MDEPLPFLSLSSRSAFDWKSEGRSRHAVPELQTACGDISTRGSVWTEKPFIPCRSYLPVVHRRRERCQAFRSNLQQHRYPGGYRRRGAGGD